MNFKYVFLTAITLLGSQAHAADKELTIYSERKEHLIKPILDIYTKETGVKVNFMSDSVATLTQRLKAEGDKSPADVLIAVDAGSLWNAAQQNLFESVKSTTLEANIPSYLRDPAGHWFGLTIRARSIVYNPKKVKPEDIKSYANLASSSFNKRLCLRSSKKVYNQSLVAMLISERGEPETEKIVKGWINNLAAPVFQDDTNVIEAIDAGQCDVGIVNSYYFGRLLKKKPELNAKLFWTAKTDGGVHINISGAGVLKASKNKEEAQKLLEWLAGEKAQKLFTDLDFEYPVNPKVQPSDFVKAWGTFDAAQGNLVKAGEQQEKATKLMDRVQYK